jgi:hypothetical protein
MRVKKIGDASDSCQAENALYFEELGQNNRTRLQEIRLAKVIAWTIDMAWRLYACPNYAPSAESCALSALPCF